jgi:hypothetical protein
MFREPSVIFREHSVTIYVTHLSKPHACVLHSKSHTPLFATCKQTKENIYETFSVIQGTFNVIQGTLSVIQGELSGRP